MAERFVKIDLDQQECEVVALMCETFEEIARMNHMTATQEQQTRVVMSRVRAKMNISASLFNPGQKKTDFEVVQGLPPWLRRN